jgi:restriction system protein
MRNHWSAREITRARKAADAANGFIDPHGGFRKLKSYQSAEIVYDATVVFCNRLIDRRSRTHDQMVQAARSGRQNIAEGSVASGTSKKTELKLVGVARASLEELLLDYQDFLRQRGLPLWGKEHPQAQAIRKLAYTENRSYGTYKTYVEGGYPEVAANTLICLIHQANYLLDQQLRHLNNLWLLGGELIRSINMDSEDREKTPMELLLENIDETGGPYCRHLDSEEQMRAYEATCKKLFKFLMERKRLKS